MPNQALLDVIKLNVRTPDKVLGDLQAQIAACKKSCEKELGDLFDRYGLETVLEYADHLQDYAEEQQSRKSSKSQMVFTVLQTILTALEEILLPLF